MQIANEVLIPKENIRVFLIKVKNFNKNDEIGSMPRLAPLSNGWG